MRLLNLNHMIDNRCDYYFNGYAVTDDNPDFIHLTGQYNPITFSEGRINFRYCKLEHLATYKLENLYITSSDFMLYYKVPDSVAVNIKHPTELFRLLTKESEIKYSFYIDKASDLLVNEGDFIAEGQIIGRIDSAQDAIERDKSRIESNSRKMEALKTEYQAGLDGLEAKKQDVNFRINASEDRISRIRQLTTIDDPDDVKTMLRQKSNELLRNETLVYSGLQSELSSINAREIELQRPYVDGIESIRTENGFFAGRINRLSSKAHVYSPATGQVTRIIITPDEKKQDLKEGDELSHELKVEVTILSKTGEQNSNEGKEDKSLKENK